MPSFTGREGCPRMRTPGGVSENEGAGVRRKKGAVRARSEPTGGSGVAGPPQRCRPLPRERRPYGAWVPDLGLPVTVSGAPCPLLPWLHRGGACQSRRTTQRQHVAPPICASLRGVGGGTAGRLRERPSALPAISAPVSEAAYDGRFSVTGEVWPPGIRTLILRRMGRRSASELEAG